MLKRGLRKAMIFLVIGILLFMTSMGLTLAAFATFDNSISDPLLTRRFLTNTTDIQPLGIETFKEGLYRVFIQFEGTDHNDVDWDVTVHFNASGGYKESLKKRDDIYPTDIMTDGNRTAVKIGDLLVKKQIRYTISVVVLNYDAPSDHPLPTLVIDQNEPTHLCLLCGSSCGVFIVSIIFFIVGSMLYRRFRKTQRLMAKSDGSHNST